MWAAYDDAALLSPELNVATPIGHFEVRNSARATFRDVAVTGYYLNGTPSPSPTVAAIRPGQAVTTSSPITAQPAAWLTDGNYVLFGGFVIEFVDDLGRRWRRNEEEPYLRVRWLWGHRWRRRDGKLEREVNSTLPLRASS